MRHTYTQNPRLSSLPSKTMVYFRIVLIGNGQYVWPGNPGLPGGSPFGSAGRNVRQPGLPQPGDRADHRLSNDCTAATSVCSDGSQSLDQDFLPGLYEVLKHVQVIRLQVRNQMALLEPSISGRYPVIERRGVLGQVLGIRKQFKVQDGICDVHVTLDSLIVVTALP